MVNLVGSAATAENEAQARNQSSTHSTPIPSITISGKAVNPQRGYKDAMRRWRIMRDCYAGELVIKAAGERYLPRPSNVEAKDYNAYLSRAYFYNATRRTHTSLLGAMMRKNPEITLPTNLRLDQDFVTIDGMSMVELIRELASEMILTTRYGILVDIPKDTPTGTAPEPYFSGYRAESIYAIRETIYKGRRIRDRIILIEENEVEDEYSTSTQVKFRVLRLDPNEDGKLVYSQELITPPTSNSAATATQETKQPIHVITQGRELDYIPFVVFNSKSLRSTIEDPLMLDLATINLSHYESTALLEHGRFYAGMPTYYISGEGAGADPLADGLGTSQPMSVGPSNVWMLEKDDRCGLLEFTGHGLTFLENAVDGKQLQMHSLGGKLIPTQRKAAALSTEAYGLMEAGDEATLLDVTLTMERGLKICLDYANDLQNNPKANNGSVELNKEFIRSELTAREVRAIQTLYERRLIPKDVLYYTLRQVGIIPMEYTLEDFTKLLNTPTQLYNEPDTQPIAGGPTLNPAVEAQKDREAAEAARLAAARANNTPPANGA